MMSSGIRMVIVVIGRLFPSRFCSFSTSVAIIPFHRGGVLLSWLVGQQVGGAIFGVPLPVVLTPLPPLVWLAVALLGSAGASALPARAASRLTIRETLAYG